MTEGSKVWLDGALVDARGAISASDRGFLVGDSVFETVLVVDGAPAFLARHLERMRVGAETLGIERVVAEQEIRDGLAALWNSSGRPSRAALRATLSRTGGRRGLLPVDASPALCLSLSHVAPPPSAMALTVVSVRRFTVAPTNAFKCVGAYAANMLARREAAGHGADEALMLNERGDLASASAANVFVLEQGRLKTPPVTEGAMPGVVRAVVIEEARRLGVPCEEDRVAASALDGAGLLITNSLIGVVRASLIGAPPEAEDPLGAALKSAYDARLARDLANARKHGATK